MTAAIRSAMDRRQPLPRLWMLTDERQSAGLWTALERLPRRSGVVFRHYGLAPQERRALFLRVKRLARRRQFLLLLGGTPALGRAWGAAGIHGRFPQRADRHQLRSFPVHNLVELKAAERAGAALVFVSPVFATRSHPGAKVLGRIGFGLIASRSPYPVIALGGVNRRRWPNLVALHAYGWGAIDAWTD